MSTEIKHDTYEVTKRLLAHHGATFSDLAGAVGRHQSALHRTLTNNPTVRTLQDVGWALGLDGSNYHWLLMPAEDVPAHLNTAFRMASDCPVVHYVQNKLDSRSVRYATWGRGPDYDPTDRSHLSQVYPAKALEGVGPEGAPLDSRFIEPEAPQPLHGKTSQGPGGATRVARHQGPGGAARAASQSTAHDTRTDAEAIGDAIKDNEAAWQAQCETPEQRQQRLSEGAPQGYRLSAKALADAPRSTFGLWRTAGWDIDKLIHHGYLEQDPAFGWEMVAKAQEQLTKEYENRKETLATVTPITDPIEARRLTASHGCPDGWILSDKALEVSEDVTYDKLARAMDVDQLKEEKYLVPRAWLGYD